MSIHAANFEPTTRQLRNDGLEFNQGASDEPPLLEQIEAKMSRRKDAFDLEEEFFVNRNGDIRDVCEKTLDLHMSLSSNPTFVGVYPKVRELLQNAIDYLELCRNGLRKPEVKAVVTSLSDGHADKRISFFVGETPLLEIETSCDRLVIYQHLTCPLEKAILQNPVVDPEKKTRKAAGGFGVGAKDAVRQWITEGASVTYFMYGDRERITWTFKDKPPSTRSSTYGSIPGFQVIVKAKRYDDASRFKPERVDTFDAKKWLQPNTLCIVVDAPRIGHEMCEVYSRIALFWDWQLDVLTLHHDGDAIMHPSNFSVGPMVGAVRPANGIYCMGLWVCDNVFEECIYLAGSNSPCAVKRRDRNIVDERMMRDAVKKLFEGILAREDDDDPCKLTLVEEFVAMLRNESFLPVLRVPLLKPQDDSFYRRALSVETTHQLAGMLPGAGIFVPFSHSELEKKSARWAKKALNRVDGTKCFFVHQDSAALVQCVSISELECDAMGRLPYDDESTPFGSVFRVLKEKFFPSNAVVSVRRDVTVEEGTETAFRSFVRVCKPKASAATIATDTSFVDASKVRKLCFQLTPYVAFDEYRLDELIKCLYSHSMWPEWGSEEELIAAINACAQRLDDGADDGAIVGATDGASGVHVVSGVPLLSVRARAPHTATDDNQDVFATLKRAMEASDLELVRKARRVE